MLSHVTNMTLQLDTCCHFCMLSHFTVVFVRLYIQHILFSISPDINLVIVYVAPYIMVLYLLNCRVVCCVV